MSKDSSAPISLYRDELLHDPRFVSPSTEKVTELFDELAARVGWGEANRAWQQACNYMDYMLDQADYA